MKSEKKTKRIDITGGFQIFAYLVIGTMIGVMIFYLIMYKSVNP